jgi:hypothetical protein
MRVGRGLRDCGRRFFARSEIARKRSKTRDFADEVKFGKNAAKLQCEAVFMRVGEHLWCLEAIFWWGGLRKKDLLFR